MKRIEHTIKQHRSPIFRVLARGRCANTVLLGRNWLVVSRLWACTPIPVHDLLWLLWLRRLLLLWWLLWWLVVSTGYALASSQPRLLLGVTGMCGRLSILRLRLIMVLLIVDGRRLLGRWLHILWLLLRRWWLSRRRLLVRCRRRSSVRRLGLWWNVRVLPRDVHAAITLTRAEPPLESTALLVLWRSVILRRLRGGLVVLRRLGLVGASHRIDGNLSCWVQSNSNAVRGRCAIWKFLLRDGNGFLAWSVTLRRRGRGGRRSRDRPLMRWDGTGVP